MANNMRYSDKVVDRFMNPRNVGRFECEDNSIGTGIAGATACGDVMQCQIKVNESTGLIEDAKFTAFGCPAAIAASSLITERIIGKTIEEARAIKNNDIATELNLPKIKKHCSVLAEEVVEAAVNDYTKRKAGEPGNAVIALIKCVVKNEPSPIDIALEKDAVINITARAIESINKLIQSKPNCIGIQINAKHGGCSGVVCNMRCISSSEGLEPIRNTALFISQSASRFISGSTLDYDSNDISFMLYNPNSMGQCGCGKSFKMPK